MFLHGQVPFRWWWPSALAFVACHWSWVHWALGLPHQLARVAVILILSLAVGLALDLRSRRAFLARERQAQQGGVPG